MNNAHPNTQPDLSLGGTFALVDLLRGRTSLLQPGPNTIGRSPKSRVVLDHHTVSRHHCVVMVHETGQCEVGDAESRNGVVLNGRRVSGTAQLEPGDVLQICNFWFVLIRSEAGTKPERVVFADETLGTVVWNDARRCWHFVVVFGPDRAVAATYSAPATPPAPHSSEWSGVRACHRWVRAGEAAARKFIEERAGNPEPVLRELVQILYTPESATLVYDEPGREVSVTVDPTGHFTSDLQWIERQSESK
jgi:hypothetical protein